MINILWDSSHLWGYLLLHAVDCAGLPRRLLKGTKIAQAGLSGKVLLVPGGSARGKALALGPAGEGAVRRFVAQGGHYMGICGGAGLALADGLGLCSWSRADLTDRMQHLVSGHIECAISGPDPLVPPGLDKSLLPVWWPSRFAEPAEAHPGVRVLARYQAPGPDLYVADLPYAAMPAEVRSEWNVMYGVNIRPSLLDRQPCVIAGNYERGDWALSYAHLETPVPEAPGFMEEGTPPVGSPRFFFQILSRWLGTDLTGCRVPEWRPALLPIRWEERILLEAREKLDALLALAEALGFLFERRPWLKGWRTGVPGSQINSLRVALYTALSLEPTPKRLSLWQQNGGEFERRFNLFEQGARSWLLARRLSETLAESQPGTLPQSLLVDQKHRLFGSHLHSSGLCGELQNSLEALLLAE